MKRLPFLDDLRFFCIIFMVAYHAGISFIQNPSPAWPAHDIYGNLNFDYLVLLLRWSRMPIVFFVSGLSAGLLLKKGGPKAFFKNRLRRIYLPMIFASLVIFPFINSIYIMSEKQCSTITCFLDIVLSGESTVTWWRIAPAHLWFLIYLLPMYLIPPAANRLFADRARPLIQTVLQSPWKLLLLSPFTFLLLYPMNDWLLLDIAINDVLPKLNLFLYYSVFFTLGWAVSLDIGVLDHFKANRRLHLAYMLFSAALLLLSLFLFRRNDMVDKNQNFPLIFLFINNLFSWVSLFFWVGVFLTISSKTHRFFKHVDGSAYWVFLAHYPVVLLLQRLLQDRILNVYFKFTLTLGGSLFLCVFTWWLYARLKRAVTAAAR